MKNLTIAITIITLLCLTANNAHAGCYRQVAQCVHAKDIGETIHYNGLCIAASCGNVHDIFNHLEFPNGEAVRVDYFKDGKKLERPETNGIPSTSFISGEELWAVRTDEGDVYIALPCDDKCSSINLGTYNKLKDQL